MLLHIIQIYSKCCQRTTFLLPISINLHSINLPVSKTFCLLLSVHKPIQKQCQEVEDLKYFLPSFCIFFISQNTSKYKAFTIRVPILGTLIVKVLCFEFLDTGHPFA